MHHRFLQASDTTAVRLACRLGCLAVILAVTPSLMTAQERLPDSSSHWVNTPAVSRDSIVGLVVDAEKGKPLDGALVMIEGSHVGVLTNSAGRFGLDVSDVTASDLVLSFGWIGYEELRATVQRAEDEGIAIQASLKKAEIVRCGLVPCYGGYHCAGGVKLVVHALFGEVPTGTPVTLIVTSGTLADTAVARAGDQREIYLAAGEDLGVDGPFHVQVYAPGYSVWETSGVWLYRDPCSKTRASPWVRAWLLPPGR